MKSNKIARICTVVALVGTAVPVASQPADAKGSSKASSKTPAAMYEWESPAEGFNTKTYFYDTGTEVVAFDAQFTPQAAGAAIAFLRSKTRNPITYLVVTHPNPDKFNGASVFQAAGAKVISSEATAKAIPIVHAYKKKFFVNVAKSFTDSTYPAQAAIDQTFTGSLTLKLKGGAKVKLRELTNPGVSTTQTVAVISSAKSIVVGDLVHNDAHAWLEGGITGNVSEGAPKPNLDGWIADLNEITKLVPASWQILGGRGTTTSVGVAIPKQIAYLKAGDQLVTTAVKALGDRKADVAKNPGLLSDELTKAFATRFPTYKLDYMITYGIYGLVAQKVSA